MRWRVALLTTIVLVGCGGEAPSGTFRGVRCASADEPGLISCREAIERAAYEAGSAGHWNADDAEARLDWYRSGRGAPRVRIWDITYHEADPLTFSGPFHPRPRPPACFEGDWGVAIDATTGEYLVEGTSGHQRRIQCPE